MLGEMDDPGYFEYQRVVVDAVTREAITENTSVVLLAGTSSTGDVGVRLSNHSHGTKPALRAQMIVTDATTGKIHTLPTHKDAMGNGVSLDFQWLELDTDPKIRLRFRAAEADAQYDVLSACFDFPYQAPSGYKLITDDKMVITRENDTVCFDLKFITAKVLAGGGIKSMEKYMSVKKRLSSTDQLLFKTLCQLRKSNNPVPMHLKMSYPIAESMESERTAQCLPHNLRYILERVPNTSYSDPKKLLKSFTHVPYYALLTGSQVRVQAGAMRKFAQIFKSVAKIPFINMYTSNVFTSITAARAKFAFAVDAEYQTEKHRLALLGKARHRMILFSYGDIVVAVIKYGPHKPFEKIHTESTHLRIEDGSSVSLKWSTPLNDEGSQYQQARGRVITHVADMPKADITVLLEDRTAKSFGAKPAGPSSIRGESNASWGLCVPAEVVRDCKLGDREKILRGKFHTVTLAIEPNHSQYNIHMATVNRLTSAKAAEFHQYVLNQQPFLEEPKRYNVLLDGIDFKSTEEREAYWELVDFEWNRLLNWQPEDNSTFKWNNKQLEFIHRLRNAPLRMLFLSGCAGTGKSYLLMALGAFFFNIGFCVMSIGTGNSNVDDHVVRMHQQHGDTIPILRLVPHSGEHGIQRTASASDPDEVTAGDYSEVHKFSYLKALRELPKARYDATRDKQLPIRVSRAAEDESMTWHITLGQPEVDDPDPTPTQMSQLIDIVFDMDILVKQHGKADDKSGTALKDAPLDRLGNASAQNPGYVHRPSHSFKVPPKGTTIEVFSEWKRILQLLREQPLSECNKINGSPHNELKRYIATIYKHCRRHVIAKSRYIATTPQGACSEEVNEFFACDRRDNQTKGFVVLHDEAMKGWEMDQWGPFMHGLRTEYGKFRLYVGVGDHLQLQPVVKSPIDLRTNMFRGQLERSGASRLIDEGLDVTHLTMQGRMHESIASFVNKEIYGGTLTTHESRTRTLKDESPKIYEAVKEFFVGLGYTKNRFGHEFEDEHMRRHHFVVEGVVRVNEVTKSKTNIEQLRFGASTLRPLFTKIFGDQTFDNVLFVVPYTEAKGMLVRLFVESQGEEDLGKEYFPRIGTIDSLQGAEATVCVTFWIVDKGQTVGDFGFTRDTGRFNVGSTRGRDLFWTVSGPLNGWAARDEKTNILLAKYVQQIGGSNHMTHLGELEPVVDELVPDYYVRRAP